MTAVFIKSCVYATHAFLNLYTLENVILQCLQTLTELRGQRKPVLLQFRCRKVIN